MVKNLPAMQENLGSITWSGKSPAGGNGKPLQWLYPWRIPGIKEPGGLQSTVSQKSRTRLSN